MVDLKKLNLLTLQYQDYLTELSIIWTIGISFFVAFVSYILVYLPNLLKELLKLTSLLLIMVSIEVVFIAIHFWIYNKKDFIKIRIENLFNSVSST